VRPESGEAKEVWECEAEEPESQGSVRKRSGRKGKSELERSGEEKRE